MNCAVFHFFTQINFHASCHNLLKYWQKKNTTIYIHVMSIAVSCFWVGSILVGFFSISFSFKIFSSLASLVQSEFWNYASDCVVYELVLTGNVIASWYLNRHLRLFCRCNRKSRKWSLWRILMVLKPTFRIISIIATEMIYQYITSVQDNAMVIFKWA